MVIETGLTIAYKCSSCGAFEFFDLSVFSLMGGKECRLLCRCGKSGITVYRRNRSGCRIKIPCMACGNDHVYSFRLSRLLIKNISSFTCPEKGIQQCFIGNDEIVRMKIDLLEKEFDELIDMFGYENYFKNTQVMFDSLNRVHDIAEQGNLCCECGSSDIELVLLSDRICLRCGKCGGSKIIHAATNRDLKKILEKRFILLATRDSGYKTCNMGMSSAAPGRERKADPD